MFPSPTLRDSQSASPRSRHASPFFASVHPVILLFIVFSPSLFLERDPTDFIFVLCARFNERNKSLGWKREGGGNATFFPRRIEPSPMPCRKSPVKFSDEIFATVLFLFLTRRIFPVHEFRELIARGLTPAFASEGFHRGWKDATQRGVTFASEIRWDRSSEDTRNFVKSLKKI